MLNKNNLNLNNLKRVSNNSVAINFLIERFSFGKKYRGLHLFQHNRYNPNKMYKILNILKEIFKESNLEWIEFPSGDEKKNINSDKGYLLGDYPWFEKIVKEIKKNTNSGTPMTLQKNFFPDWEKMGLIERHSEIENKRKRNYFKLNKIILNYDINYWEKVNLYKECISIKIEKFISPIFELLKKLDEIKFHEFLLFFTYIEKLDNGIDDVYKYINDWRELTRQQREFTINFLKNYMDPKHYITLSKNNKKDWSNFCNESLDILEKFKESHLFKITKENSIVLKYSYNKKSFSRDKRIYEEYYLKHNIEKEKGFEMDHIVKFCLATTPEDLPYIDNVLNLLYIDGKNHSIKTSYRSDHMYLKFEKNKIIIENKNISNNHRFLDLILNKNVKFNMKFGDEYLKHNVKTIEKVYNKN